MTKYREELSETVFEEDFNSLGIIFKQKEAKYTKPYQYFIAMRNKQLGLIEEPQDLEEDPVNNDDGEITGPSNN